MTNFIGNNERGWKSKLGPHLQDLCASLRISVGNKRNCHGFFGKGECCNKGEAQKTLFWGWNIGCGDEGVKKERGKGGSHHKQSQHKVKRILTVAGKLGNRRNYSQLLLVYTNLPKVPIRQC